MSLNWYKIAQRKPVYTDYGHEFGIDPPPHVMWFIDENWNLKTQTINKQMQTHKQWFGLQGLSLQAKYCIAQGRYDVEKKIVAIGYISMDETEIPPSQVMQNIYAILNDAFNNPKIINFAKSKKNIKVAFPVMEQDYYNRPNYADIGHDEDIKHGYKTYVWYIDNNWQIHAYESQELLKDIKSQKPDFEYSFVAHDDLEIEARDPNLFIARGRVVERPDKSMATYSLSTRITKQGLFAERKYRQKIEQILDRTFDSPQIYTY